MWTARIFCETCLICYDKRAKTPHTCKETKCRYCLSSDIHCIEEPTHCDKCNMFIRYGKVCKEIHEKTCQALIIQCKMCGTNYPSAEKHTCVSYKCIYCSKMVEKGHICYIDAWRKPVKNPQYQAWCWDIESTIDPVTKYHKPAKICAIEFETGIRKVWNNLTDFINFFLTLDIRLKLYAHNGKAYDTYLLRTHLIEVMKMSPKSVIMRGQKIIYLSLKNIEFLDSMNHLTGSLQSQVATFGIKTGDKGYEKNQ